MKPRTQSGFTLIELIITLVVIGVLMLAGMPSLFEWMTNLRIRTVSESVLNGLRTARTEAVRRNADMMFVIGAAEPTWQVQRNDTLEVISRSEFGNTPVVTQLSPANTVAVTFGPLGITKNNPDGSPPIAQIDLTVPETLLSAANARSLRILISGGMVRMCDPNVAGDAREC
jgi:type IV fimbrial biogenesis protein FimT